MVRPTHTFATLAISPDAHAEIKRKLLAVDYGHIVIEDPEGCLLDMHGIGLIEEKMRDTSIDRESIEALLHRLWGKAVGAPDYVKDDWKTLQAYLAKVEAASKPE